jgi:acetyl-CoA C-acetyltransferase
MKKVYIIGAKRSPIGSFMGALSTVHPSDLGAQVLKALLEESKVNKADINEVIVGNILPAGAGQGIGRQVSILSGIPVTVPAYSINMACGSGMKALMTAYLNIGFGVHDLVVAGGVESMSQAPYLVPSTIRQGVKMGDQMMKDHMIFDALTDAFNGYHMGITAENIVDMYHIDRESQDRFAIHSQEKAIKAQDLGLFKDEIVPIKIQTRKGEIVVSDDEYINRQTSYDKLSQLRPAFKKDGSVTAGNASGINDGSSFTILASEDYVKKHGLIPLAEVIGIGQGGVDPKVMGLGPTPAIKHALNHANLSFNDLDFIELNEAFAAQSLGVIHELKEAFGVSTEQIMSKTNLNGGAIALGHPVGASGNRIIVTLLHQMLKQEGSKIGLASLCIGGGMGTAVVIRKV